MKTSRLILAIETALANGSLSILEDERQLDSFSGSKATKALRLENLLEEIKNLFVKNNLRLKDIDSIAVSTGPGSFTGIRIGLAAAQALSLSLDCPIIGVSILEALAYSSENKGKIISVVPASREQIFWQEFERDPLFETKDKAQWGELADLIEIIDSDSAQDLSIVVSSNIKNIFESFNEKLKKRRQIKIASDNASVLVGLFSLWKQRNYSELTKNPLPQYILDVEIGRRK